MTEAEVRKPRTDAEIVQRILDIKKRGEFLPFESHDLINRLPFAATVPFHNGTPEELDVLKAEWQQLPRDDVALEKEMREYMVFALEKAIDHRGLSANRSRNHYCAWLWLVGNDGLLAFCEDAGNYRNYGMPMLKAICDAYDFPFPLDDNGALNMASGKPCYDGCEEGCS